MDIALRCKNAGKLNWYLSSDDTQTNAVDEAPHAQNIKTANCGGLSKIHSAVLIRLPEPSPAPAEQAQRSEAGGEEWEGCWKRGSVDAHIVQHRPETTIICSAGKTNQRISICRGKS